MVEYLQNFQLNLPYMMGDLADLSYAADMLYLAHQGHNPAKIMRYSDLDWRFGYLEFLPEITAPSILLARAVGDIPSGEKSRTHYDYVVTAIDAETGEESLASSSARVDKAAPLSQTYYIELRPAQNGPTAFELAENPALMLDAMQVAQLYQDNAQIFDEMDKEIARLENETRAAITANPLLVDKIRAQGQTVDYVAKKVAALHEKYALGHARHGLDPLEFLRKVIFDENYARQREAEIAARSAEAAQENVPPEAEINEPAAETAPVAEEEAASENMAAEETVAQD